MHPPSNRRNMPAPSPTLCCCYLTLTLISILLSSTTAATNSTAELTALLHLKSTLVITTTDQQNSNNNLFSNWVPTQPTPCNFTGVTCNPATNSVISLDLSHHHLSLSSSITALPLDILCTNLPSLKKLAFGFNSLTGPIPPTGLSNCRNLTYLDLGNNAFSGEFPDISSLTNLQHLYLNLTGLTGEFPWKSISSLTQLITLSVGDNSFDVTPFPTSITNLQDLTWLYLSNCSLSGSIPSSIGNLTNLINLELSDNQLTGTIPPSISKLTSLWQLELFDNSLTGTIPIGFRNLTNLQFFDASHNSLTGNLSELRYLTKLISLQLYENDFTGGLPPEFGEFRNLVNLSLYTNNLEGEVPQSLGSWTSFDLLDISTNSFTGPIPPDMCKHGKMRKLLILQNKFSGEIPSTYANCSSLLRFRVSENSLSGIIPAGIWGLPKAEIIDVADNSFTGPITDDISRATSLGTILAANNRLSGQLPSAMSGATSLGKVDFRNNEISGPIPDTIGKVKSLNTLYLSDNRFSGEIPSSLGSCVHLSDLNLGGNEVSGQIPASLGKLTGLYSLNLSSNQLSGQIPDTFNSLRLSILDVSYNQLTGPVPPSLVNDAYRSSYIGNPVLCSPELVENRYLKPCRSTSGGDGETRTSIIVCFVLGSLVLVSLVMLLAYLKLKGQKDNREKSLKDDYSWDLKSYHILSFTEDEILDSIVPDNLIGKGGCGDVYRVTLKDGKSTLAVKHIWTGSNPQAVPLLRNKRRSKEFDTEVGMLSSIRHVNVVKLFCSITSEDSSLLVYEYLRNGSLWDQLHCDGSKKLGGLDWVTRYEIALGAAKGLEYLHHGCERPVIHRDIKSSNILLDELLKPKIADFGLAKIVQSAGNEASSTTSHHVVAGTHGYIAPEYGYTYKINEKSDVYSFGVVLMELVTGKKPVMEAEYGEKGDLVSWVSTKLKSRESVLSIVDPSIPEPSSLREEAIKVLKIAILCTSRVPDHRPNMRSVVQMLVDADPCKPIPLVSVVVEK